MYFLQDRDQAWKTWSSMLNRITKCHVLNMSQNSLWSYIDFARMSSNKYSNWLWWPEKVQKNRIKDRVSKNITWCRKYAIVMDFNLFLFEKKVEPNNIQSTLAYEHSLLSLASILKVMPSSSNSTDFYLKTTNGKNKYRYLQFRCDCKQTCSEWMEELDYQIKIINDLLKIPFIKLKCADPNNTLWLPTPVAVRKNLSKTLSMCTSPVSENGIRFATSINTGIKHEKKRKNIRTHAIAKKHLKNIYSHTIAVKSCPTKKKKKSGSGGKKSGSKNNIFVKKKRKRFGSTKKNTVKSSRTLRMSSSSISKATNTKKNKNIQKQKNKKTQSPKKLSRKSIELDKNPQYLNHNDRRVRSAHKQSKSGVIFPRNTNISRRKKNRIPIRHQLRVKQSSVKLTKSHRHKKNMSTMNAKTARNLRMMVNIKPMRKSKSKTRVKTKSAKNSNTIRVRKLVNVDEYYQKFVKKQEQKLETASARNIMSAGSGRSKNKHHRSYTHHLNAEPSNVSRLSFVEENKEKDKYSINNKLPFQHRIF